jgi:hypothetical protein
MLRTIACHVLARTGQQWQAVSPHVARGAAHGQDVAACAGFVPHIVPGALLLPVCGIGGTQTCQCAIFPPCHSVTLPFCHLPLCWPCLPPTVLLLTVWLQHSVPELAMRFLSCLPNNVERGHAVAQVPAQRRVQRPCGCLIAFPTTFVEAMQSLGGLPTNL